LTSLAEDAIATGAAVDAGVTLRPEADEMIASAEQTILGSGVG
jgi:hypothetical protein